MNADAITIRPAAAADLAELLALLDAVKLPHEGVADCLAGFLVARDAAGRLVGCVGLEQHGEVGLLRSAAVAPALQRAGLGARLVAALLERARAQGVREVTLLTATARDFFAHRFGFVTADRAAYETRLAASPEWHLPRCASAVFMRLTLAATGAQAGESTGLPAE
ncbi:MAG TPA: GNAT family N-acetyltransferase [Pyrinomonadaceae bacterium]|jgi:amino-acid N-acetyltransferase